MKKMTSLFAILFIMAMIVACGGQATPAQASSGKDPAAEVKQEAEQAPAQEDQDTEAAPEEQEAEAQVTEPAKEAQETETAIEDPTKVYYWRVRNSKLEGLIGPNQFGTYDMELPQEVTDEAVVLAFNDAKTMILLKEGPALYQIDLENKEYTLLNEGAVDSKYDQISGICYFYGVDHEECYISDWRNPSVIESGEVVENYLSIPPTLEWSGFEGGYWEELRDYFIQEDYLQLDDNGVYISPEGEVYDFYAERISNINCKTTISEFTIGNGTSVVYVKDNRLIVDSIGNEVMSIDLPEGSWTPIAASDTMDVFLLYNSDEQKISKVENQQIKDMYMDVADCKVSESEKELFYVSNNSGYYVSSWIDETEPELSIDEVLGVSHYSKYPGFIVEDGEININGVNITVR